MQKEPLPRQAKLPESSQIYDFSSRRFVTGYRKDFKRQETITLIDAITFNAAITSKVSSVFSVGAFANGLLLLGIDVTGAPTDITFDLEFSHDRQNFFKYIVGSFGSLVYEDAAGDKTDCLDFPILAPYMRLTATATGTDAVKTFLTNVHAILNG